MLCIFRKKSKARKFISLKHLSSKYILAAAEEQAFGLSARKWGGLFLWPQSVSQLPGKKAS